VAVNSSACYLIYRKLEVSNIPSFLSVLLLTSASRAELHGGVNIGIFPPNSPVPISTDHTVLLTSYFPLPVPSPDTQIRI
jgi:hypothetical protein